MKTKILAVMLSAFMTVAMLSGCGDRENSGGKKDTTGTEDKADRAGSKDGEDRSERDEPSEYLRSIQGTWYDSNGNIALQIEQEFTENGDLTRTFSNGMGFGTEDFTIDYEYDAAGNVTKAFWHNYRRSNNPDLDDAEYIYLWYEIEYDTAGRVIKCTQYTPNANLHFGNNAEEGNNSYVTRQYEKEYNAAGQEIKYIEYKYGNEYKNGETVSGLVFSYWFEYEYNAAGQEVKITSYSEDGSVRAWKEYEYNAAGQEAKYTGYYSDGTVGEETEYNAVGQEVKHTVYFSDGRISDWYEREYNAAGQEVKYTMYSSNDKVSDWYEREYNAAGQEVKYTVYDSDGNVTEETEYNDAGQEMKYTNYYNAYWEDNIGGIVNHSYWLEYEYSAGGQKVKCTKYGEDGSAIGWYEREFDPVNCKLQYSIYGKPTDFGIQELDRSYLNSDHSARERAKEEQRQLIRISNFQ